MKDDFSIKGEVIAALESVTDPVSGQDLVSAHMVEAVNVAGGVVDLTLNVDKSYARDARFALEDEIYDKVEAIGGVSEVRIKSMSPEALKRAASGEPAPKPTPKPAPQAAASQAVPASAPVEGVGKIIAVASGKGGVGKSTVAVNLALALKHLGYRVGLLDVDIYGPSLPTLLGVNKRPQVRERRIVPLDVGGLRLMSLGFLMEDDTPVIWRGPIVTGIIRQFLRDVDWSGLDYLVVDMPPGTGDAQLALAQTVPVDGAVIVSTPSELALIDAARGLQMFKTLNIDVLGLVENMSRFVSPTGEVAYIFGQDTVRKEAERLEVPFLGDITIDPAIRAGGDEGKPIVLANPEAPSSLAFLDIARKVAAAKPVGAEAGEDKPAAKKGLFSFLKS